MKNIIKSQNFILYALLFFSLSYSNLAQGIETQLIEYSLSISNENTEFKYDVANIYETKTQQLGINWYESFSPYFHAGLELGNIEMTQLENPLSSAKLTTGQYAGLLLRFTPFKASYLSLMLNLNYRYNRTKGENTDQQTQFHWGQTLVSTELKLFAIDDIELFAAAEYQNTQGTQQNIGITNQTTAFQASNQQGSRFGINFKTNHNGILGVEWLNGFRKGVQLHFRRKF